MKNIIKMTALTALLSARSFAFADAADELQNRLNQVTVLSADFAQTVTSVGGKMFNKEVENFKLNVQIFSVWIPNHHKKHKLLQMVNPWYYDPFVQQVTAQWVMDAVNNTPLCF